MAEVNKKHSTSGRPCSHEDYAPGSVTMTEVWGHEGFRPFG